MKFFKFVISGEVIFFLFIISGAFKSILTFVPIDLTLILMCLSMLIAFKRILFTKLLPNLAVTPIVLFFLLGLLMLISTFYSPSASYDVEKSVKFITVTAWSFIGGFFLVKDTDSLQKFLKAVIISTTIISIFTLKEYFTTYNELTYRFGLGGNPLSVAQVSALGALVSFFYALENGKRFTSRIIYLFLFSTLFFTSVITGSRMPIISLVITILLVVFFSSISTTTKNFAIRKSFIRNLLVLLLMITIFVNFNDNSSFETFNSRFDSLLEGDASSYERLNRYNFAFGMFESNLLLGNGIGSFGVLYDSIDGRSYPHNIFVEIISELGILGILMFITFLLIGFYRIIKGAKDGLNNVQIIVISITFFAFLNANVSGDINDNRMFFSFFALSCLIYLFDNKYHEKNILEIKLYKES